MNAPKRARPRRLTLTQAEPIARDATRNALMPFKGRPELRDENLTLGTGIEDAEFTCELYLAGERPQDAVVISRATVDRLTGEVRVQVLLQP